MRVMMHVVAALLLVASNGRAELRWLGGEGPPFAFVADITGGMHGGDTLRLVVALAGRYPTSASVSAHLSIPAELGLIRGDTTITGPLEEVRGNWTLMLRPLQAGEYEVRGRISIDAGTQGTDEAEFALPVEVRTDTVAVQHSRYTRLELRKAGQRFRYSDWWLVPLDSTEAPALESEIQARDSRARPTVQAMAVCQRCAASAAPDSIHFVVVVGPDGRVRDWKLLGSSLQRGRRPGPEIRAAAEEALMKCVFQPAHANGQAISDWTYVSIPVRRSP